MEGAAFTSNYREFAPGPSLPGFVVCFWSQVVDASNAGVVQPVFPDGCVDILWRDSDDPVLVGAMTTVHQAALTPGLRLFGVRLAPGAAGALLRVPLGEITDREVPLADILPRARRDRLAPLDPITYSLPTAELRAKVDRHLTALFPGPGPRDSIVSAAVRSLCGAPDTRIGDLAGGLGVSERQLNRRFTAAVGYSPGRFRRIARLQRFLHLSAVLPPTSLAGLALDAGYNDQPHLTRECQALTGRSPGTLIMDPHSALAMSDLFNTNQTR